MEDQNAAAIAPSNNNIRPMIKIKINFIEDCFIFVAGTMLKKNSNEISYFYNDATREVYHKIILVLAMLYLNQKFISLHVLIEVFLGI